MARERSFRIRLRGAERGFAAIRDGEEETLGAADKGIAAFVEAKMLIGGARNADTDRSSDWHDGMAGFAQPEHAGGAKFEAVVAMGGLPSGDDGRGSGGEVEERRPVG